jgi:hypothetical protein
MCHKIQEQSRINQQNLKIMGRKVTIKEGLSEMFVNITIVYICYAPVQWEPNPLKWNFSVQCLAVFMACVYFPYMSNQRWKREQDKVE